MLEILIIPFIGAALQVVLAKLASREFLQLFKKRGLELKHLRELKFLLLTIAAVLTDAEEKEITNPSVSLWVDELKDAVYEAEDVLDEISTTANLKQAFSSDLTEKMQDVIFRLNSVAEHKDVLGLKGRGGKASSRMPTTSLVSEPEVLGREDDRKAILEFLLPDSRNESEILMNSSNISMEIAKCPLDEEGDHVVNENGHGAIQNCGTVTPRDNGAPAIVNSRSHPSQNDEIFSIDKDEAAAANGNGEQAQANENEAPADDGEITHVDDNEAVAARENRVHVDQSKVGAEGNQCDREEISVLAIVGMPGVGKTTLAQDLFNRLKDKFDMKAWVHVSEEFDLLKAAKVIYDNIAPHDDQRLSQTADFSTLQFRIQEASKKKRILLVLDDVWNEHFDDWDVLKRPFRDVASGSTIILTSRSIGVASSARAIHIRHLSCLSDDDCWSLFTKHAGKNEVVDKHPEIKERILKKCKGLPLAAKAFGALLYRKLNFDEWNDILNSELWDIPSDKCSILPMLRLSYYHLPSHLKCCFAYCSIFPKGYQIDKLNLVRLWMAQGLVMQQRNKRREEVGDEYFHELLSRSFFQQSGSQDKPYFIMHDLLNDLARDVAGEFCFNFEDGIQNDVAEKLRHFSFFAEKYDVPEKFDSFKCANHLRTFLPLKLISSEQVRVLSNSALKSLLKASNHLRVISLSPYKIHKLDDCISNLKYLRYLDLSHSLIKVLPDSICSLYNLETLLLMECRQLTDLPKEMKKLVNLQQLNIQKTKLNKMPEKFGRLKNLHVLTDFVVGDSGSTISQLKELSDLGGALSIINLEKVDKKHAAVANLKGKKYLTELVFQWTRGIHHNIENEEGVLDGLQPNKNLKKLTITNYGGTVFQTWLGDASFSKMVYLHLVGCENCSSLPSLGQLSSLKELYIANMKKVANVGSEFCQSAASSIEPFKSLEILKFENMPIWTSFTIEERLPCLQKLHLHNCPKLSKSLPKGLPSLDTLYISQCPALELEFLENDLEQSYAVLKNLEVRSSCYFLVTFSFDYTAKLKNLKIQSCNYLRSFQYSLDSPICLEILEIQDCPNLEIFTKAEILSNLQLLSVKNCRKLLIPQADWGLHNMGKLNSLEIEGGYVGVESFPDEGLLPVNLHSLRVSGLMDLLSLNHVALQHLTSLKTLEIDNCDSLNCISDEQLPLSLACLMITACPSLENRYRRGGQDWHKLSHISNIIIDGDRN